MNRRFLMGIKITTQLGIISLFLFNPFSKALPIEIRLVGVTGGKTDEALIQPVDLFAEVNAEANGEKRNDRDPEREGKVDARTRNVIAEVPDFTKDDAVAGGRAKAELKILSVQVPGRNPGDPPRIIEVNQVHVTLRARADIPLNEKGDKVGTANSVSLVNTDPLGAFFDFDDDGLENDAIALFYLQPDLTTPIFNNVDPKSDSGSILLETNVQGSFFTGNVYKIGATISGENEPISFVDIAPEWQIFDAITASPLTPSEFESDWNSYITTPNGTGFGGQSPFGALFVYKDVPNEMLNEEWTWDSSVSVQVEASVPEPTSPLVLLALATLGGTSTLKRKLQSSKSTKQRE